MLHDQGAGEMGEAARDESAKSTFRAGMVIAQKYRLVEQKGAGAMGAVWSAAHVTLGHAVAIKFLHNAIAASDESRARFEREARLAARLGEASRHITRVIDHGVTDDATPYLVMELLPGESLSDRLKREKRLSLRLIAKIVQQLSRALHVAHSAGVIHRDLKPANVFICPAEDNDEVFVKLLDFGVAKATAEGEDEQTTKTGQLFGTPGYMSPEQILGEKLDVRADLWAVAAIVYRAAVGRSPFGGGGLSEIGVRILSTEPAPPSQVTGDLPVELDMWMARGLAKKRDERFQSARELADFLAAIAGTGAQTAAQSGGGVATSLAPPWSNDSSSHPRADETLAAPELDIVVPRKRRRRFVAFLGAGGAAIALVTVWLVARDPSAPAAASPTNATSATNASTVGAATTTASASASHAPVTAPSPTAASPTTAAPPTTSAKTKPTGTVKKSTDTSGWNNKKEL